MEEPEIIYEEENFFFFDFAVFMSDFPFSANNFLPFQEFSELAGSHILMNNVTVNIE